MYCASDITQEKLFFRVKGSKKMKMTQVIKQLDALFNSDENKVFRYSDGCIISCGQGTKAVLCILYAYSIK